MKITVVGAVLIVAAVVAGVLLLFALNGKNSALNNQQNSGSQEDESWRQGLWG